MKTTSIVLIILITFLIFGCAAPGGISTLRNSTKCFTTIEGYFSTPQVYKYPDITPAVLFNSGYKLSYKSGTVIKQNEEGIYLVEKQYSSLHKPDTLFFQKSLIRAIVDLSHFCVYGNLKEKECSETTMKFYLQKADGKGDPVCLELTSNSKFSFCIEPGKYKIEGIIKELTEDSFIISYPVFECTFDVKADCANYIGDIAITGNEDNNAKNISIPFCKLIRSEHQGLSVLLYGTIWDDYKNKGLRNEIAARLNFRIQHSENYKSDSNMPVNICPVDFHPNY